MRKEKKLLFSGKRDELTTGNSLMKIMLNSICETLAMKMGTGTNW
jgi:hypothetical protein